MGIIKLALSLIIFLLLLTSAGARDGEGMRVVPAQEILDKIERGEPVEYDHVTVEGDLDLSELDLPEKHIKKTSNEIMLGLNEKASMVSSSIKIIDSTINGSIHFSNSILKDLVNFNGSHFKGAARFKGSAFNGDAKFEDSEFNGTAYFEGSAFYGDADFWRSKFNGSAYFKDSEFNGSAYFRDSEFNGDAGFGISKFNGVADFWRSKFNGVADFGGSAFYDDADFGSLEFNGDAGFVDSAFNGSANFGDSKFNGDADFKRSKFNGDAKFEHSEFNGDANFDESAFNDNANFGYSSFDDSRFSLAEFNKPAIFDYVNFINSISFNSTRFKEDAIFEGAVFNGTLYLTKAKYDRIYIRWNCIKEMGYDNAAYLALLENFKKLGYVEDYDACYYEYRRLHRDQPWSGKYHAMHPSEEWLRKRIDLGLQAFYGYGKKPIWPLLWSVGTILLFGLIWRRAGVDGGRGRGGIFERFGPQIRKLSLEEQLRALFGAMLFSATLFLSGTRLFVDPPAMPALEGWFAAHARGFFIAERVLGAFFSIHFFLAISGTVVR